MPTINEFINIISSGELITDGNRRVGDYDNNGRTNDVFIPILSLRFDSSVVASGSSVVDLYQIPGSGTGISNESYPFAGGGDGIIGENIDPSASMFVGSFNTIKPSATEVEFLALPEITLYPDGNRFIIKNISGQTFHGETQFDIKTSRIPRT